MDLKNYTDDFLRDIIDDLLEKAKEKGNYCENCNALLDDVNVLKEDVEDEA